MLCHLPSTEIEMQVIRRVAALAYSFVSINYDQVTAFRYLLRPAGKKACPTAHASSPSGEPRGGNLW